MPRPSVWLLRAALVHLALGFTVGAVLLAHKGIPFAPDATLLLRPAHRELLLVGWTIQLVMGVAFWIFPRRRLSGSPYGRESLAWLAFALLNGGVWLAIAGSANVPWLVLLGRAAEAGAAAAFAANLWGRVRAFGLSQI